MTNNTNNIQSQNPSVVYERLYQVHQNVAQLDAPIQLNQLPQDIRNQVYGQVYELANRPQTDDAEWGRNNAFRDFRRLQRGIQQVGFNNFRSLPIEQRNPVAERIWIYGGRQQGDPHWGENHANDNVDILFRSLIEGLGGRPVTSGNTLTFAELVSHIFEGDSRINDSIFFRGLGERQISLVPNNPQPRTNSNVTTVLNPPNTHVTGNWGTTPTSRPASSTNSEAPRSGVTNTQLRDMMRRMGISYEEPVSILEDIPASPEEMISRKAAAKARVDQINNMGDQRNNQFELSSAISTFNLDVLLQNYEENHNPRRLLELVDWAGIDNDKRNRLTGAVERYGNGTILLERLVTTHLSKLFSYFDQRKDQPEVPQEALKVQYRAIVDKIIDANRNCVDQMLSQLQEMLLDIVVDGFVPTEGNRELGKIQCRAGQELCLYKTQLIKQICVRQNPNESHMADLERLVMRRLSALLGLQGAIFNSGAQFGSLLSDVDDKINRAVDTFWQEYNPMQYLTNQLSTSETTMSKLRNEMLMWADGHYAITAEDEDNVQENDMNPRLSADFNPAQFKDFLNGGVWSAAGALFLMEAAGLIRQR